MKTKLKTILAGTLILIASGLPAVYAQPESSVRLQGVVAGHPQFETFVSAVRTNFAFAENRTGNSLGLRGSYAFTNRFAVEGSVNKLENSFTFGDVWMADLSAKLYVKNKGRTAVYVLGGPGMIRSSDLEDSETTVHLGVGAEILAGRHLYLRPEVRGRWFTELLDASATVGELSLGIGWRF